MPLLVAVVFLLCSPLPAVVHSFSIKNDAKKIQYRNGRKSDELKISSTMIKELMNPLGIQADRFVVATTTTANDDPVGWAQIRPLGKAQLLRDPSRFNAPPGSYDIEQEVDDAMWDDFENDDSIQVPVGLASLPWTKEYRAMMEAVKDRDQRREELRARRERELTKLQLWELASVYVEPAYRGQGIGTELVRRVLKRHFQQNSNPQAPANVYCLTLANTTKWYEQNFGFEIVSAKKDIPKAMALEVAAGNVITKLIGAQLCCMRGTPKMLKLCKKTGL
jgi:GNAT superfamily N-acetyltransferase